MRDDVLYSEEIIALLQMVEAECGRHEVTEFNSMVALGGLHKKLSAMREQAPSLKSLTAAVS
jgi:hypothetical protein